MDQRLQDIAGWEVCLLSDVLSLKNGYAFKSSEYQALGVPIIRISDIHDGVVTNENAKCIYESEEFDSYMVESGDILIAMSGATTGKFGVYKADKKAYQNQRVGNFRLHSHNNVNKKFIYYLLYSLKRQIEKGAYGGAQPNISAGKIENLGFSLPPLNEQHRIVEKIEELFSELYKGIESLETAREQLKVYRQALLKHAFEGKLTEQWRKDNADTLETADQLLARIQQERETRYQQQLDNQKKAVKNWEAKGKNGKKPTKPKNLSELNSSSILCKDLPKGWVAIKAEFVSDFITKGTTPKKDELFSNEGEIPFLKVYNLTKNGSLNFSIDPTFVNKDTHDGFLSRSKVLPNDVLMNIVGPPLGKVSIVTDSYPEWNINQAIVRFRSGIVDCRYLANYLLTELALRSMMKKAKATAGQFNLTLEICREIMLPICGRDEQTIIVNILDEKLSVISNTEKDIDDNISRLEILRQSILKKAFSGQLISQDPTDEPASELLKRIVAEKAKITEQVKSARTRAKKTTGKAKSKLK